MKKIILITLSIFLACGLVGCSKETETSTVSEVAPKQIEKQNPQEIDIPKIIKSENVSTDYYDSNELNSYIDNILVPALSVGDDNIINDLRADSESYRIDRDQLFEILRLNEQASLSSDIDSRRMNVGDMIYLYDINNDAIDDLLFIEHGGSLGNDLLHCISGIQNMQFDFSKHIIIDAFRVEPIFFKVIDDESYIIRIYSNFNYKQIYKFGIEKIVDDQYYSALFEVNDVSYQKLQMYGDSTFWDTYIDEHKIDFLIGKLYEATTLDENCTRETCTLDAISFTKQKFIPSSAGTHYHLTVSENPNSTGAISKILELSNLDPNPIVLDKDPLLEFVLEDTENETIVHLLQYRRNGNFFASGYSISQSNDVDLIYEIEYQKTYQDFNS